MRLNLKAMGHFKWKLVAATWAVSTILTFGAASSLVNAAHVRAVHVQSGKTPPKIDQTIVAIPAPELADIVKQMSVLHPDVKIDVRPNGNLRVAIRAEVHYGEWRAAMADLMQAGAPDTVFETVSICGAGCDGAYCAAEFSVKKIRYIVI
jgi:hypothetical protein